MHFSLKILLAITTVFALVIAASVLAYSNLDTIHYPMGLLCTFVIPTAPFLSASLCLRMGRCMSEPSALVAGLEVVVQEEMNPV